MGFHLRKRESVHAAVRRIATEEILGAIHDIRTREPDTHEAVHDFRRRCKKMRGLLRLIRPHLGDAFPIENALYRDLSRALSYVRDVQALIEALDRLTVHFADELDASQLVHVRNHLVDRRNQAGGGEAKLIEQLESFVAPLEEALQRVPAWQVPEREFETFVEGLSKTYRRGRKAMAIAFDDPTTEHFHEWRKRVKYHWHHTLLLRKISPTYLRPHRDVADHLGELLGQDHDYAVLQERLSQMEGDVQFVDQRQRVEIFIERRQRELRLEMHLIGQHMHAESAKCLAARWRAYWRAWRGTS